MFYNPRKTRNLYNPKAKEPYRLSRSRIEQFIRCQRCFWLHCRHGIEPPSMPFTLNNAVDELLKREFDIHRSKQSTHPLLKSYGLDAVPYSHPKMEEWRDARTRGITFYHDLTNFIVCGGIDDVWINPEGELIIVDYKATAKNSEVTLDADWQWGYKRQVEIYQWLFRKNGFPVSRTAYFVYANGQSDRKAFDGKLEFDVKLIPYEARDDSWVDEALMNASWCLGSDDLPQTGKDCEFCAYRKAAGETIQMALEKKDAPAASKRVKK